MIAVSETNSSLPAGTANMTIMLLSDSDKEDVTWVVQHLKALAKRNNMIDEHYVDDLRKLYQLS